MIGADRQAVKLEVVSGVRDHRKVAGWEGAPQPIGEFRTTNAASEQNDAWAQFVVHAVRRGSTSAPNALAHSTWLRPTLCR